MNLEDKEFQLEEDVLSFLSQPAFQLEIERAKDYFDKHLGGIQNDTEAVVDFSTWLVNDYYLQDGESFLKKYYQANKEQLLPEQLLFIEEKLKSYLKLYEVIEKKENVLEVRALFTKETSIVHVEENIDVEPKDLMLARMIWHEDQYYFVGSKWAISKMFKSTIERKLYQDYEEYTQKNHFGTWEKFLKEHSVLLYQYLNVIEDLITHEAEDQEGYYVWQSVYLVKDTRKIKQLLLDHSQIELQEQENGNWYFKILSQQEMLCEMVLKNNRIEIECNSELERRRAKKIVEKIVGDEARHYKDELLSIDDLV